MLTGSLLHHVSDVEPLLRLWTCARHTLCRLHGHDLQLDIEPSHISLQCVSCGFRTEGWHLDRGHAGHGDTR